MRHNQLLAVALAVGTTACATETVPDELSGETGDGEAGKADTGGTFTYWQVELAGDGYRVSRANRAVTECGDGTRGESCDVASLDLAGTALPASVATGYEDRLRAGGALLLRGELGPERPGLTYARLAKLAGPAIASADLAPALPPTAPSIHVGDESGPDCLYARLFVQDVDVDTAELTVTPTPAGTLAFRGRFGGVSIPSTTEHAISCVNGTSQLTIRVTTLVATGTLTVNADGSIAFTDTSYQLDGVTYDSANPPPAAIYDLLFSRPAEIGTIVTSSVALALAPRLATNQHARALAATEVWLPGSVDATDLSGVFVLAKQDGTRILERRINSTRFASIDELDLAASGATGEDVARATAALGGDGVLVVGYRYTDGAKHGRAANQFWTKAPVPLH